MPLYLHPTTGKFLTQKVSMGALGDSYYEYLLKVWLLKNKSEDMYRAMWEQAMDDMIACLLFASTPSRLKYIADYDRCACTSGNSWCNTRLPPAASGSEQEPPHPGQKLYCSTLGSSPQPYASSTHRQQLPCTQCVVLASAMQPRCFASIA